MFHNKTSLYRRLEYPDSIRLLKLWSAASEDDILEGELIEARLSEKPLYQALSYMWGPEDYRGDGASELRIGDEFILLRPNLAYALRAIRKHRYDSRVAADCALWMDLVCIEQNSIEEKNHQVAQMGSVYSEAICVLTWLGKQTSLMRYGSALTADEAFIAYYLRFDRDEVNRAIFCALLNQHWHRTWILQETGLARDLLIFTEDQVFGEEDQFIFWGARSTTQLLNSQFHDSTYEEQDPRVIIKTTVRTFIELYERHITRHNRWTLLDLIGEFGAASGCADYRDKVFALRALAKNGDRIRVDYAVESLVLFWSVIEGHDIKEIYSKHIWGLKNALQLDWNFLFVYTRRQLLLDSRFLRIYIPVHFEQGSWRVRPAEPPDTERSGKANPASPWQLLGVVDMEFDSNRAYLAFDISSVSSKTYQVKKVALISATNADKVYRELELPESHMEVLPRNWRGFSEDQSTLSPNTASVDSVLYAAMSSLTETKSFSYLLHLDKGIPSGDDGTCVSSRPARLTQKWIAMASSPDKSD